MIDLALEEVCLLRVALTHLAVTGKGKCAVVGDSARVFHDVMGKLTNCRQGSAQDVGLDELRLAKMLLKKNFAKKLSALLCEKTQELLDDFDNDTTFEPTIGEEEHKELLDWADKFVDNEETSKILSEFEKTISKRMHKYLDGNKVAILREFDGILNKSSFAGTKMHDEMLEWASYFISSKFIVV